MLRQKVILSYSTKILMQIIQVAVTIVVARVAGASVLGTVAFGMAYVSMFIFISDLGLGSAHIKLVSEGEDEASCNGTFIRIQAVLAGAFFIVVLLFYLGQKYVFNYQFESPVHEEVIMVTLIAVTISRALYIFKACFMAKTEQAKQDIPAFIELILFQTMRLIVVLIGYKALAIAFSKLASIVLTAPLYFFLFKNYLVGAFDRKLARKYFLISVPVMIITISDSFTFYIDKVLLQHLTNSAEVGYYVAGFKIGSFIMMIGTSVGLLFFPTFSRAISENNFDRINTIIEKYEHFSLAFVFPATALLAIFSDLIVNVILGAEYVKTIPVLAVINISAFTYTLITPYGNVLSGKGLFKLLAKIYLADLVFFIIMVPVTVHTGLLNLGSTGLALSVLGARVFMGILFIIFVGRRMKQIKLVPGLKLLLFGILYSVGAFLVYREYPMTLTQKLLFAFIYFAGYWGLATLFRFIRRKDWAMISDLLNLKKMLNYLKAELLQRVKKKQIDKNTDNPIDNDSQTNNKPTKRPTDRKTQGDKQ